VYEANVLTNYSTVYIDYQFRPSEDVMPTYFAQLMKYYLAWHFAEPVTDQITKAQYYQFLATGNPGENFRGGMFRQAMQIDGASRPTQAFIDYPLISARAI
jgi:hypothetical protein